MANDISKTSIINLALANLGQKLISSPTEETQTARTANLMYDFVRRNLLRAHDWVFAMRDEELSASTLESPIVELPYMYVLPADNLYVRKIFYKGMPFNHPYRWKLLNDAHGNKLIACQFQNAKITYVADVQDVSLFEPNFVMCFALLLAAELAIPLAGDGQIAQLLFSKYQSKLDEARQTNKIEQFEVPVEISAFLEAR